MNPFEPLTRRVALSSWRAFLPKVASYAGSRNHVQAGHENVSRLGACIRFRTLLEDEIIEDTLNQYTFQVAQKWLQEICWRRYWRAWLETRPHVWRRWRQQVRSSRQALPPQTLARAEAVSAGRSGVACMDKIARELIETGYLHNHSRMWWASFWIHVEQLPWELGADFFFRHLLDADPASNTLSWRWVAGLQTPGKSYLVRLSNIEKYAPGYLRGNETGSERLDDGVVSVRSPLEVANFARSPLVEYPTSLFQATGRRGLWLHADDFLPEIGPLADLAPASVAAYLSERVYKTIYDLSPQRISSLRAVTQDGLDRAAAHYACPAVVVEAEDPVLGLGAWAKDEGLAEVVAFAPLIGPVHDILSRLKLHFAKLNVRLTLIRRPSDVTAFSFATAGFFPFWEKMSRHLNPPH